MKKKLQSGVDYSTLSDQLLIRSDMKKKISFKIDCFYCGRKCELDHKFSDRNPFQYVAIMETKNLIKNITDM